MSIALVSSPFLDEQAARIRARSVSWESYQRAGQISAEDLAQLKKIDKQPAEKLNSVLMGEGPQYALLFMSMLKKLARTEPTQVVLVLIGDALTDHEERAGLFLRTGDEDPELPFGPFVKALDSDDEFVRLKSAQLLTALLTLPTNPPSPAHVLSPLLHKLSINIQSSSPHAQDVSLQSLAALLAIRQARTLAWQAPTHEAIKAVVKILRGPPVPAPQTAYLAGYVMWLMSFDDEFAKGANSDFDLVSVLVGIAQGAGKEKVIRVIIATFKNLATKAPAENLPSMLVAKLLPFCKNLATRKWTDEEIVEDVTFLRDLLQQNFESLSTYDEYTSELASGHLSWSPVHESESFWKENAAKLDEKDYAQIKRLVELLKTSEDNTVLAVAAHDLGQYVKHHDRGKKIVTDLGGKARVMELMTHSNPDVRYRALLSVQRLVSAPWVVS
ncbi:V-type H+-transporting ATPase 54 kD subunit [Ceratobasidium sp. AG-Ba]|nr:V-type H+-transporting ATPase 54 kD subunit [Ceratobasidium sp. AG-Ba]QRW04314.1 V-type H+-transporting ATPase 54 kD subunit [Ceratobasidium sp. AG-Ba]